MAKFLNCVFNEKQSVNDVLIFFEGLNNKRIAFLCARFGIVPSLFFKNMPKYKLKKLEDYISQNFLFERRLKFFKKRMLGQKIKLGSYKGIRLKQGLPSRGQRTKTNARTSRRLIRGVTRGLAIAKKKK